MSEKKKSTKISTRSNISKKRVTKRTRFTDAYRALVRAGRIQIGGLVFENELPMPLWPLADAGHNSISPPQSHTQAKHAGYYLVAMVTQQLYHKLYSDYPAHPWLVG